MEPRRMLPRPLQFAVRQREGKAGAVVCRLDANEPLAAVVLQRTDVIAETFAKGLRLPRHLVDGILHPGFPQPRTFEGKHETLARCPERVIASLTDPVVDLV